MKTLQRLSRFIVVSLLALTVCITQAQAADNYLVIQRGTTGIGDGAATYVRSFALPPNISTSGAITKSAVLQLMADGVLYTHNEVYVNPPTTVCTDDGSEDANQSASIGVLSAHADSEMYTEHRAFSSTRLQPGLNRLMFCARTEAGLADNAVNNVDNFSVHSIVLHYKTD